MNGAIKWQLLTTSRLCINCVCVITLCPLGGACVRYTDCTHSHRLEDLFSMCVHYDNTAMISASPNSASSFYQPNSNTFHCRGRYILSKWHDCSFSTYKCNKPPVVYLPTAQIRRRSASLLIPRRPTHFVVANSKSAHFPYRAYQTFTPHQWKAVAFSSRLDQIN